MVEPGLEFGFDALEAETLVEPLCYRVSMFAEKSGDVADTEPVATDCQRDEFDSLSCKCRTPLGCHLARVP